jgi:hypothetical protein
VTGKGCQHAPAARRACSPDLTRVLNPNLVTRTNDPVLLAELVFTLLRSTRGDLLFLSRSKLLGLAAQCGAPSQEARNALHDR